MPRERIPEDDVIELGEEDAEALEEQKNADEPAVIIQHLVVTGQREADVSLSHRTPSHIYDDS